MRFGSLFSGYNGLDLGVQSILGGTTAWFCEFDKAPSKILAHHWPDVPNLGDITQVDWATVEPVDVLTGGSPCQDLSHAGKRAGMTEGTRSNLWVQMREAIDALRPRLVVWENVRGALSAPADSDLEPCPGCVGGPDDGPVLRALGRVLGDLSELGYDSWWTSLRAADVGAAHGRFRVFLFATPADSEGTGAWGHERGLRAVTERGGEGGPQGQALTPLLPTPQAHDAKGFAGEGYNEGNLPQIVRDRLTLLPTPVVSDMGASYTPEEWDAWTAKMQAAHGNGNGHGKSLSVEAQRLLPTPTVNDAGNVGGASQWDRNSVPLSHALLPTPTASDSNGPGAHGDGGMDLRTTVSLLPAPRATDGTKGGPNQRGSSGDLMLPSAVAHMGERCSECGCGEPLHDGNGHGKSLAIEAQRPLLKTPTATERANGRAWRFESMGEDRRFDLSDQVASLTTRNKWGDYGPAIARWEHATGRAAPAPTEPGPKGNPCLSPRFVEFLMGLPDGHVTDPAIGISRNEQLKALGNGVVPQQAAAATRAFVEDMTRAVAS